jgi:hypothetical protein
MGAEAGSEGEVTLDIPTAALVATIVWFFGGLVLMFTKVKNLSFGLKVLATTIWLWGVVGLCLVADQKATWGKVVGCLIAMPILATALELRILLRSRLS